MSPVQDCPGGWLVLSYSPITLPATDQQMNRITVRAIIFKLMKRTVLSVISKSPWLTNWMSFIEWPQLLHGCNLLLIVFKQTLLFRFIFLFQLLFGSIKIFLHKRKNCFGDFLPFPWRRYFVQGYCNFNHLRCQVFILSRSDIKSFERRPAGQL